MIQEIENKVINLSRQLMRHNWTFEEEASLYSGKSGMAIHYALLYKYTQNESYEVHAYKLISDTLNNLKSLHHKTSLSGIAGVAWTLQYLVKIDFLEYNEVSEYIQELKQLIIESLELDFKLRNYDLMHGFIGKMLTLIDLYKYQPNHNKDIPFLIEKSIQVLQNSAQRNSLKHIYWNTPYEESRVFTGMAHGVSSILWYLSLLLDCNIVNLDTKQQITHLIEDCSKWLLNTEVKKNKGELCIPIQTSSEGCVLNEVYSLAWCHGDLGVAIGLIKAGKVLNNSYFLSEGIRIAENASQVPVENSTILQENEILDCSLCHGIFGAFFIFYNLFEITGNKQFEAAYKYWLKHILTTIDENCAFLNLKNGRRTKTQLVWEQNPGLLSGLTGNALSLLTFILMEKVIKIKDNWFKIFF